jgi:hypothetical protein
MGAHSVRERELRKGESISFTLFVLVVDFFPKAES